MLKRVACSGVMREADRAGVRPEGALPSQAAVVEPALPLEAALASPRAEPPLSRGAWGGLGPPARRRRHPRCRRPHPAARWDQGGPRSRGAPRTWAGARTRAAGAPPCPRARGTPWPTRARG
jgi:hypothetical protein